MQKTDLVEPEEFESAAALKLWLSEALVHETDPHAILRVTAEAVGRFLGVTRIGYGEVEPGEDWMTIPVDWTDRIPSMVGRIPIYRENAFVRAYQRGETMVVSDVRTLNLPPEEAAMLEETFCRSCISVPLVHQGELVALFSATYREARDWSAEEVELVETVGARTWAALRHVRAIERLKESEEQFRQLAENFPGICWLAGPDGLAYWMNARGLEFYGDAGGVKNDASAVVHPDDLPAAMELMAEALSEGKAVETTLRSRGVEGVYHPFLSRMVPIRDETGAITRWCGVQVDLTEKQSRDRHEAFFRYVTEAIRDETDAGRILSIVSNALQEHLGLARVLYIEFEEENRGYIVHHGATAQGALWADRLFRMPEAFMPLHEAFARGETYVTSDVRKLSPMMNEQVRDYYDAQNIRSGINVPLVKEGRLLAVLGAQDSRVREWTPEEIRLVEELAERTWATITRAQAETALKERERHQRFLVEWSDVLREQGSDAEILSATLEMLATHLSVSRANYSTVADDERSFTIRAEWRDRSAASTLGEQYALHIVGDEIRRRFVAGDTVGSDDIENDTRIDEGARGAYRKRTVGAFLSVPLVREGRVRAVFSLQQVKARRWREGERRLLRDVADRTWVILERARAEAALKERERHGRFLIAWNDALRDRTSPTSILALTLEKLAEHLGASRANYGARDEADGLFVTLAEWRRDGVAGSIGARYEVEAVGAEIHRRFEAGELVRCDDIESDTRLEEKDRAFHRANDVGAFASVPLVRSGRVCAVLSIKEPGPRRWCEQELELLRDVADRAWVVLERARAEEALKERERNQTFLLSWTDAVRTLTSPDRIVAETIERLGRHLRAARANYAEGNNHGTSFAVLQEWRRDLGTDGAVTPRREGLSDGVHEAYLTGDVVVVEDVHADHRFAPEAKRAYADVDAVSFLGVPMIRGGRVKAVLSVQHGRAHRWRPAEVQLIRDVADRTWTMLERSRAEAALQEREREQAFLIEWSDAIRAEVGPRAILATTLRRLGEYIRVDRANYAEVVGPGEMEVVQEWGWAEPLVGRRYEYARLGERVIESHLSGRTLVAEDVGAHPLFDETARGAYLALGIRAGISVPLVRDGRLVAVLSVQTSAPRAWTQAEERLVTEIAHRAWTALDRARFEERMAESEALLATFMENAPIGMHLKDASGRYLRINQELSHAIGRPREEILGRTVAEFMDADVAREVERLERQAVSGQRVSAELTRADPAHNDGRYVAALSIAFPIEGHGQARTGGFTIDLTDRKTAEAALQRSREALYQTEKLSALGSLLAGVSHELNNPLSIVVAQAVMMERQAAGTELADRAFKIRRAADRCARIVQTFLAMARAKRPEREPVDLNSVAVAALDLADYGLRTDGVTVERRLSPDLPRIAADADQLHQVIINLVVNAQQAMKEAGTPARRLVVTTERGPEPDTVVLDVADNGPGVPEELRRRVFEPFFTTKPQGEGTGVGLSFSQGLAEAHGGRLALLPSGEGATFRLTLPTDSTLTLPCVAPEAAVPQPAPARRALVVDDEREIAEALADFLSVEGFECEVAIGGVAAKERLVDGRYDLVVSDLRMPDVDGPELHAWVAATRPDIAARMAFTTGDTLGASAERFLKGVHRPVLEKPFTPESVRALIERVEAVA